ncbi:MAG: hypothetical protein KUG72_08405 [Pseudomonadales bacterium]|nr:hypothetical protein [Pseudomonadales bacterium]
MDKTSTIDDKLFWLAVSSFIALMFMLTFLNSAGIEGEGSYFVKTMGLVFSLSFGLPGTYIWLKMLFFSIKSKRYVRVFLLLIFNIVAAMGFFWSDRGFKQ